MEWFTYHGFTGEHLHALRYRTKAAIRHCEQKVASVRCRDNEGCECEVWAAFGNYENACHAS